MKRGTRREIRLAVRAIRAARTHLSIARTGLVAENDAVVLQQLRMLGWGVDDLLALLSAKAKPFVAPKPNAALRKAMRKFKRRAA